jgi:hypothetical protein
MVSPRCEGWRWSEVNPLTRSLVAVFSGYVGSGSRQLSNEALQISLTEAFGEDRSRGFIKGLKTSGWVGVRSAIGSQLAGLAPNRVRESVEAVAPLAGGADSIVKVAQIVGERITGPDRNEVSHSLQLLSELAVVRLLPDNIDRK